MIIYFIISHYRRINAQVKKLYDSSFQNAETYLLLSKTDLDGKITYVSDGLCEVSGYTKDELIGQYHSLLRHKDQEDKTFKDMWQTIKSKKVWKGTVKNKKKNGEGYYVDTTIVPDINEKNEHIGYISVRKDVSAEINLKTKNTFIESILNTSDSIILTTNGHELLSVNQRFFEIFDYTDFNEFKTKHTSISELFLNKEDCYIKSVEDNKNWLEQLKYNPKHSTLDVNKVYMLDKNGNERIFQIKTTGKLYEDKDIEVVTLSEITILIKNRKLLESQTKYAAMGEMISMIAHQWNQPLASLVTINSKIKTMFTLNRLDKKTLDESFVKSNNIISHLSNTINDFRNYFHRDEVPIKTTITNEIDKSLEIIEDLLTSKKIKLEKNYDDIVEFIEIDVYGSSIKQILLNLIKNAIDAIIDVNPQEKFIKISAEDFGTYIELSIEDSAGGIPEDTIYKIFEPYFSTKSLNGTGLGLYMSKMIVEDHLKGSISVENTSNGALFKLIIPR